MDNNPPSPSGIEAEVIKDIAQRQQHGINKYGTTVADNPLPLRAWLQHQYEELLDAAVYCRRAIEEIDKEQRQKASRFDSETGQCSICDQLPGACLCSLRY